MQTNTYTHIYTYICHLSLFMYILEKSLKYRFSHGKSYKFNCTNSQNLICHACNIVVTCLIKVHIILDFVV